MTVQQIFELIVGNLVDVMPDLAQHSFQMTDSMKELGANSIDRMEVVVSTLEALDLKLPLVATIAAANMGELAELLHEKLH